MARAKNLIAFKKPLLVSVHSDQESFTADVLVSHNGEITYIGNEIDEEDMEADIVIDATGKWLIPGFISAHSHFWQSAFLGQASDKTVNEWSEAIYEPA